MNQQLKKYSCGNDIHWRVADLETGLVSDRVDNDVRKILEEDPSLISVFACIYEPPACKVTGTKVQYREPSPTLRILSKKENQEEE